MRNLINANQSYTGLVQKYIGSAYDVVYAVYLALQEIKDLHGIIGTPEWESLVKIAPEFEELMKRLALFSDVFYGALPDEPTARPSGDPSMSGDLYYDTTKMGLFIYEDGAWKRMGATDNQLEVIEVTQQHVKGSYIEIPVAAGYQPNHNSIMVFVNATYQYPQTAQTPDGAYLEQDSHTLIFPYNPNQTGTLQVGDVVTVLIGGAVTNIEHQLSVRTEVHVVTAPSQTEFKVNMGYSTTGNNIEVFVDGIRQVRGKNYDYTAPDGSRIIFTTPIPNAAVVVFKVGDIVGNANSNTTNLQLMDSVGEFYFRAAQLDEGRPVMCLGHTHPGDGGEGIFVYQMEPASTANGGTVIDAQLPLDQQGQGGNRLGVWVRQYGREIKFQWFGHDSETVSDLPELGTPQDGDTVYVTGYHEPGDGAEGWFVWDASRDQADHDGGMVIAPNKPFPGTWAQTYQDMADWYLPKAGAGVAQGCWVRMNPLNASLYWYGAKDDGVTDNSDVFKFIAAGFRNPELVQLLIPNGEFLIDGDCGQFVGLENVKIYGVGNGRIVYGPNALERGLSFKNCRNIYLENFRLFEKRTTAHGSGLHFQGGQHYDLKNLNFWDFHKYCYVAEPDPANPKGMGQVLIQDCVFSQCPGDEGHLIQHEPARKSNQIVITDCGFHQCGTSDGSPALVLLGVGMHGATLRNCTFRNCKAPGVRVSAWQEAVVAENHFTECLARCVVIDIKDSELSMIGADLTLCIVRDNVVDNITNPTAHPVIDVVMNTVIGHGPIETERNYIATGMLLLAGSIAELTTRDRQVSDTAPTWTGQQGDIVYNSLPTGGGYVGWVHDGTNWREFGEIV